MATTPAPTMREALLFTARLLDVADFDDVRNVLLPGLGGLFGSDLVAYHAVQRERGEEIALAWPTDTYKSQYLVAYPALMAQHPIAQYAIASPGQPGPVRISDWLSRRQWHANPVYRDSYRHMSIDDQMAATATDRGAVFTGVSIGRHGRSYNDAERDLCALVQPHIAAALRRAESAPVEVPALQVAPLLGPASVGGRAAATDVARDQRLTSREAEVMSLLARGLTDQQISRRLGVSRRTVNKHLEHVYAKLGVSNRLAALREIRASGRPSYAESGKPA